MRYDGSTKSNLWNNKIKHDCISQKVLFTIRNNRVDLYHKGGLLFRFDSNEYRTHIKYASVITSEKEDKEYLTEKQLSNYPLVSDFETNYKRIKENCSKYSGDEAKGVSAIYHKHSFLSKCNVVVLDIEVSFESEEKDKKQDRIDIVLFNKTTKTLQFVEAKHFSNKEIWSNDTPKVLNQLKRYELQIERRKSEILIEYIELMRTLNRIFDLSLPKPVDFNEHVTLLIFGFDNDQKNGRLNKLIIKNPKYKGLKIYSKGNIKDVDPENIWNAKEL